jgi:hypothetical protein
MSDVMGGLAAQDQYPPEGPAGDVTPWDTLRRYASAPRRAIEGAIGSLATLPQRAFQASEQMRTEGPYDPAPAVEAAMLPMGTGAVAGVKAAPGEAVFGAGAVRKVKTPKEAPGEILAPEAPANVSGTAAEQTAPAVIRRDTSVADPYITGAQRVAFPDIYGDPRQIAARAAAQVAPEHPALKQLFGVNRQDLYDIGQQGRRQGNIETQLWASDKPRPNAAAQGIMTPANAQRLIDANAEALKYPELARGMDAWYVMDPMYQQMERLVGPERAKAEYRAFNATVPPFSAATEVPVEIRRGTAANMFRVQGRYPEFLQYGGLPPQKRLHLPELADVPGHAYHSTAQARPVANWINTGSHQYAPDTVKVPLYIDASGVPQTGFQTRLPVPDAHFTRAVGMSDTRTGTDFGKFMGGTEYREAGPWFRENVAKPLGIEAVPAQARTWGVFSPITGVDTPIGAPKLELIAKSIWERAKQLGVDPHMFRDRVLLGKEHAQLEDDGSRRMGGLADQSRYG